MATGSYPHRQMENLVSSAEPSLGSRTMTLTIDNPQAQTSSNTSSSPHQPSLLVLRARPLVENPTRVRQTRVQWGENVIDNEGLGRKKSKVCCIYKKPKQFDESSDESNQSSGSEECCHHSRPTPFSTSHPPPTTSAPSLIDSHPSEIPSAPSTAPVAPNAYEAEPLNVKGKGKAQQA